MSASTPAKEPPITHPANPPPATAPAVLQVEGLCFSHPQRPLFNQLNLRIAPGVTRLHDNGEGGSGKTTLLRLLAGALPADAGQFRLRGMALADNPQAYRQQVFWADPQATALDQTVVGDYFASLPAQHPNFNNDLLADVAEGLSLVPHWHKPLYMLSTGSKRKVWLAAAFASGVTVTLLDDPLAALDGASAALVLELLQEAAQHPSRAWIVACHEPLAGVPAALVDLSLR